MNKEKIELGEWLQRQEREWLLRESPALLPPLERPTIPWTDLR